MHGLRGDFMCLRKELVEVSWCDIRLFSLSNAVVSENFCFQVSVVLKTFLSLLGHLEPGSARIAADRRTHRLTDAQTKYFNPRLACAPRLYD